MKLQASGAVLALTLAVAAPAHAQESGRGFLFGRPDWNVALHGGFAHANAQSDIFTFATNQLTLNRSDFDGLSAGADLSYSLKPNLDLVFGVAYSGSDRRSEFRKFLDNNNLPIEQKTKFSRVPVTASLKWYPVSRGRSVGRFAWIPSRYAPFVGAGAGLMFYRFEQAGDFVDFKTSNVFNQTYTSSSWAKTAHLLAGLEYAVSPRWSLTSEARYAWAKADLDRDFSGFKPIDLSGFATTLGFIVRF